MDVIVKMSITLLMLTNVSARMREVRKGFDVHIADQIKDQKNLIANDRILDKFESTGEIDCTRKCADSDNCLSFFYNENTKSCQLHSSGLYSMPTPSTSGSPGERFYRMNEEGSPPIDCYDTLLDSNGGSGVYTIYPSGKPVSVYCDHDTDGGGWLVFQRREDGSENFSRVWDDYENGFGDIKKEFWLGNDLLSNLTSQRKYILRIDLEDFENVTVFAQYESFAVGPASTNYTLLAEGYNGTAAVEEVFLPLLTNAGIPFGCKHRNVIVYNNRFLEDGDGLMSHTGFEFSTKDRDNDIHRHNCAVKFHGGWWYKNCHTANLNGLYLRGYFFSIVC